MNNRYDLEDYVVPKMRSFLEKRKNTLIKGEVGCETCPNCIKMRSLGCDEIFLTDLKFNYTLKIYGYLRDPLEKTINQYSRHLLDNFKCEQIYLSLFGRHRKGNTYIFNKSLYLDFFIFIIEDQDNNIQRESFLIPALERFLKMREETTIIKDL